MKTFRDYLSWLVPHISRERRHLFYRNQEYVTAREWESAHSANDVLIAQKETLRANIARLEAEVGELRAKMTLKAQANDVLQARLERAEAKFEAACIVNHLQKQKQTSYEREVYAASMGGMVLDNQEEIARIAASIHKNRNVLSESNLGTKD